MRPPAKDSLARGKSQLTTTASASNTKSIDRDNAPCQVTSHPNPSGGYRLGHLQASPLQSPLPHPALWPARAWSPSSCRAFLPTPLRRDVLLPASRPVVTVAEDSYGALTFDPGHTSRLGVDSVVGRRHLLSCVLLLLLLSATYTAQRCSCRGPGGRPLVNHASELPSFPSAWRGTILKHAGGRSGIDSAERNARAVKGGLSRRVGRWVDG